MMFRAVSLHRVARSCVRSFATRRILQPKPLAPEILDALPSYKEIEEVVESEDPMAYHRNPVTSAHCIDVEKQQVSTLDSAAISPNGNVMHGKYGDLGNAADSIPLEYLALLHPAAEGAAAIRHILQKSKHAGSGTILVYGASQANGMAAVQLASSAGHAVVAVVGGEHSGNDTFVECLKGMISEPGTAVPEEYALSKKNFADLVQSISSGDEGIATPSPEEYLADFKANLLDYAVAFPDTRPAAVSERHMEFKYMEKDRETFDINMQAFLEQYPPGSPPMDKAKLDAYFSTEQYEIFREKFWKQTSGVISGDDTPFSAPHIVLKQIGAPEILDHRTYPGAEAEVPYSFSVLKQFFPPGTEMKAGGPILGAVIVATPTLVAAATKIATAKTLRKKGEALQFLTSAQRGTFGAACSVASQARWAGAPIVVVGGSLPQLETVKATEADVKEALAAMDVDENGNSRLNYFVQIYRASDYPFYADYAVHRASEVLAGPRQIIVTK